MQSFLMLDVARHQYEEGLTAARQPHLSRGQRGWSASAGRFARWASTGLSAVAALLLQAALPR